MKFDINHLLWLHAYGSLANIVIFPAEGRKAHWALITGYILLSHGEENLTFIQDEQILPHSLENKEIKLFGRQSKSLVLGKLQKFHVWFDK